MDDTSLFYCIRFCNKSKKMEEKNKQNWTKTSGINQWQHWSDVTLYLSCITISRFRQENGLKKLTQSTLCQKECLFFQSLVKDLREEGPLERSA